MQSRAVAMLGSHNDTEPAIDTPHDTLKPCDEGPSDECDIRCPLYFECRQHECEGEQ